MLCPKCDSNASVVIWKPMKGLDPDIRKYLCDNVTCNHIFYSRTGQHFSKDQAKQQELNSAQRL